MGSICVWESESKVQKRYSFIYSIFKLGQEIIREIIWFLKNIYVFWNLEFLNWIQSPKHSFHILNLDKKLLDKSF